MKMGKRGNRKVGNEGKAERTFLFDIQSLDSFLFPHM